MQKSKTGARKVKLMQESKKLVQESISGVKIGNRKSMPVKERYVTLASTYIRSTNPYLN